MIVSAIKTQKEFFKEKGKRISYDDAIKICKNNPFLDPIEGNNDKFKLKNEAEIKAVMERIQKEQAEKEAKDE